MVFILCGHPPSYIGGPLFGASMYKTRSVSSPVPMFMMVHYGQGLLFELSFFEALVSSSLLYLKLVIPQGVPEDLVEF